MRISDWSSDVCSSDLIKVGSLPSGDGGVPDDGTVTAAKITADTGEQAALRVKIGAASSTALTALDGTVRSEEHTSELQSLMRISYAVFCLKKKKTIQKLRKTNEKIE